MKIIVNKSYLSTTQGSSILPKLVCMVLLLISSPLPACGSDSAGPSTLRDLNLGTNELGDQTIYNVNIKKIVERAIRYAEERNTQRAAGSQQHSTAVRQAEEVIAPQEEDSQQHSTAVRQEEEVIAQQEEDSQQPSTAVRPEEENDQQDADSQQPSTDVRPEEENDQQDADSQQPSTARQEEGRNAPQDAGSQQYSTLDLKNQSGSSSSVNTQERASGS